MVRIHWRMIVLCVLVLAGPALVGCGDDDAPTKPTAHVSGKVTVDGKELPANLSTAQITFRGSAMDQAGASSSPIKPDGTYDVPDAPKGEVTVEFLIRYPTGKNIVPEDGSRGEAEYKDVVPPETSQTVTIDGDNPNLNFDL